MASPRREKMADRPAGERKSGSTAAEISKGNRGGGEGKELGRGSQNGSKKMIKQVKSYLAKLRRGKPKSSR